MRQSLRPTVVHVVPNMNVGGISSLLSTVLPKMSKEFSTVVCSIGSTRLADRFASRGVEVVSCPVPTRIGPVGQWRLSRFLREKRARIVHTHGYAAGISATLASKLAGVDVVISHVHAMRPWDGERQRFQERLAARLRDCIVFVSRAAMSSYLRHIPCPGCQCVVVYNGADAPSDEAAGLRRETRKSLGIDEDAKVIVSAGRLVASKRLDVFLEVCASVMAASPDVAAVIVGDGPERKRLERKARELGLSDRVVITGVRRDIYPLLSQGDVFLTTSEAEGFGLAVLEAMRAGVPVVSSRLDSIEEFAGDGASVALAPAGDREAFTRHIVGILKDRERARRMAADASRRAQSFSSEACAARLRDIYWSLLSDKTNGRAREPRTLSPR